MMLIFYKNIVLYHDYDNDMESFEKNYKDKFKIIDTINGGAGSARNKALDITTWEYIKNLLVG